ncbi:MAG: hypothetical protein ACC654_10950 [Acidimicrobiia bacterium]
MDVQTLTLWKKQNTHCGVCVEAGSGCGRNQFFGDEVLDRVA